MGAIIHWATPPVTIDVSVNAFAFRCRDRIETIEPVLWINNKGRTARLVAIGANPVLPESADRVDLFTSEWQRRPDRERMELVDAFCRYGLRKVMGRWLALPTVSVRVTSALPETEATMRDVLGRVLQMPKAWELVWEDDGGV